MRRFIIGSVAIAVVVGVTWLGNKAHEESKQIAANKAEAMTPMPQHVLDTLLNLTAWQGQQLVNASGKACPTATSLRKSKFSDTDEPYAVVHCSDGNGYVVSWNSKLGRVHALSCSWGMC